MSLFFATAHDDIGGRDRAVRDLALLAAPVHRFAHYDAVPHSCWGIGAMAVAVASAPEMVCCSTPSSSLQGPATARGAWAVAETERPGSEDYENRGGEPLHVVRVARGGALSLRQVLQDVSNGVRSAKRDWQAPIQLSRVPVHFGERQEL